MSTPDPLSQFSGSTPPSTSSSDSMAQGALAQIPQLQQESSSASSSQAKVGQSQASDLLNTEQQLNQLDSNPPQRNTKIMDLAPLFIGLTAVGGRLTGIHAKTMLAATNGMVQGMLQGSQQAFEDSQRQFEQSRKKILELSQLRQQYYDTLYRAYGDTAMAKEKAIKAARDLVNDGFKHDMDVLKAESQSKALEQKLMLGLQGLDLKELQTQVSQMKESAQEKHWQNQDNINQQKVDEKVKSGKDAQSDIMNDIQALRQELKASNGGVAGVRGAINRGLEVAKTATGIGDQDAPAHRFQSRVEAMLLKIPKAMTGTSRSAKDERARVDEIGNLLKMGTTGPIAEEKLNELEQIMKHQTYEPSPQQGGTPGAAGGAQVGGMSSNLQAKANDIREQVRSGKMTREQGVAALLSLGGDSAQHEYEGFTGPN